MCYMSYNVLILLRCYCYSFVRYLFKFPMVHDLELNYLFDSSSCSAAVVKLYVIRCKWCCYFSHSFMLICSITVRAQKWFVLIPVIIK